MNFFEDIKIIEDYMKKHPPIEPIGIKVRMKDGEIVKTEPEGIIGHVSVPFLKWMENPGYA